MNDVEKLTKQLRAIGITFALYVIISTIAFVLYTNEIYDREKTNENSIYNIELAHLMELNNLTISDIKQLPEGDARFLCRFSYMDFRFVDRCIEDMKLIKEEKP